MMFSKIFIFKKEEGTKMLRNGKIKKEARKDRVN
jgi:hypothetical protein